MAQLRRLLPMASWIGLALSLLTLIEATPRLLEEGGGIAMVLGNVAQFGWTLALLLLAFAWTRTTGTRALTEWINVISELDRFSKLMVVLA